MKNDEKIFYLFDGTKEGFLTAFVLAYKRENARVGSSAKQLSLGETAVTVATDEALAQKAELRLASFDRDLPHDLSTLFRVSDGERDEVAFKYCKLLADEKRPVGKRLAEPSVFRAVELMKRVGFEVHRFHGFIRFTETASGALYAPFSPDNDICDLLAPHFRARLPKLPFVLHDVKRKKATVYDGQNTFTAPLEKADILLSADEEAWQVLWKRYYRAVNIPSRERLKQMRGYMPVRYWQFLPEKQD